MTELNSSLCQLNWLIAKGGIGNVQGTEASFIPEPVSKPVEVLPPQPVQPTQPTPVPEVTAKRRIYEGSDKPPYSYSQLIRFAIEDTVDKRCTLAEIYSYISHNFIFYRENRNASWKNSIRHNLSLNKQFNRVEKAEGDRRGWWVCVDPPAKKPRILKGSPVRVNPIYEHLYQSGKNSQESRHTENNVSSDKNQEIPPQTAPPSNSVDPFLSEINEEGNDLTEREIRDLNLFESYDLNSSFRDVYNQIFEKPTSPNEKKKAAQIDWLKISLEAAGLDYHDEQELERVDTDKLKGSFKEEEQKKEICLQITFTMASQQNATVNPLLRGLIVVVSHSSSDSGLSNTMQPIQGNDSDEEYDWDRLL
ncbi:CRE-FKH-8 protein [Caenorhabditis remanei]|uniref:Forkhead box protein pes-1 n=1 Tax=Caenorhabditis remanei TaxID=31234 RepID=E3LRB3_CAERE|nr:CRE-FKH-8 protein [Caenorhabditis remanei]